MEARDVVFSPWTLLACGWVNNRALLKVIMEVRFQIAVGSMALNQFQMLQFKFIIPYLESVSII